MGFIAVHLTELSFQQKGKNYFIIVTIEDF